MLFHCTEGLSGLCSAMQIIDIIMLEQVIGLGRGIYRLQGDMTGTVGILQHSLAVWQPNAEHLSIFQEDPGWSAIFQKNILC